MKKYKATSWLCLILIVTSFVDVYGFTFYDKGDTVGGGYKCIGAWSKYSDGVNTVFEFRYNNSLYITNGRYGRTWVAACEDPGYYTSYYYIAKSSNIKGKLRLVVYSNDTNPKRVCDKGGKYTYLHARSAKDFFEDVQFTDHRDPYEQVTKVYAARTEVYEKTPNEPPTVPRFNYDPSYVYNGKSVYVRWDPSTDPDGDSITYYLEVSEGGTSWRNKYSGSSTSTVVSVNVSSSVNELQFRLRAYDGEEYSSYDYSNPITVIHNSPPPTPSSISVPTFIKGGASHKISWGASKDPDGDKVTYELQRSLNGGSFSTIYTGSNTFTTDTIPKHKYSSVRYRVRAFDPSKAYSGFVTSETRTVTNNESPKIETLTLDSNVYLSKNKGFNTLEVKGALNDPDSGDNITIKYSISGSGISDKKLTSLTANGENQDFSGNIVIDSSVPSGEREVNLWAVDNRGASSNIVKRTIKVDNTTPTISVPTPTGYTNGNVVLKPEVKDSHSGIKVKKYSEGNKGVDYFTSNGETWTDSITVDKNGTYTVYTIDNVGNPTVKTVNVNVIDKEPDKIGVDMASSDWVAKSLHPTVTVTKTGVAPIKDTKYAITKSNAEPISWKYLEAKGGTVDIEGTGEWYLHVKTEDKAGNTNYKVFGPYKIDLVKPVFDQVEIVNTTHNSIEIEIVGAKDGESGLDTSNGYASFSIDGGNSWTSWSKTPKHKFEGLNINKTYDFLAKVRDKAGNEYEGSTQVSTLTSDIKLTHNKQEGSNEVLLNIDLLNNPPNTQTMITRQNMITGESVIIKDWSNMQVFRDRVPTFIVGYRYSAYARNNDGIIGTPSSIEIKDPEEPEITVKGFGRDKYIYDEDSQSLFILGTPSGYLEWEVMTQATDNLVYEVTDSTGKVVKAGDGYGRVGEYRYSFQTPLQLQPKETYKVKLSSRVNTGEGNKKEIELTNESLNVYCVNTLKDLINIKAHMLNSNEMQFGYDDRSSFPNSVAQEVASNGAVRDLLASLEVVDSNGNSLPLHKGTPTTLPIGDVTLRKEVEGGTYEEVLKKDSVSVRTNISSFITKLEDDESWNLEVYVTTSKGRYSLPEDSTRFKQDGYDLEVQVAKGLTNVTGTEWEKYQLTKKHATETYGLDSLYNFTVTNPLQATVGVKVVDTLPTYRVETLNLQNSSSSLTTLDAIGNPNYQYDSVYLYNKVSSKMKEHGEIVYEDGNWKSELYYRTGSGQGKLLLITREKIKVFSNGLEELTELTQNVSNTGSALVSNSLYLGTSDGLMTVGADGTLTPTAFTQPVQAVTTDGFSLFVATSEGLHILDNKLGEKQFLRNEDVFGSPTPIKTLYTSNGSVYAGKDLLGNEYTVIGK